MHLDRNWNVDLTLGVESLDADHQGLVELIGRFEAVVATPGDGGTEAIVLLELIAATSEHFLREQDVMREADYPAYETHVQEHNRMLEQILSLGADRARWREAGLGQLRGWFVNHVQKADRAFADFLRGH